MNGQIVSGFFSVIVCRGLSGRVDRFLGGFSLSFMHHSVISLVVKSNLTLFFGVVSCTWTIIGRSAECFPSVDGFGMGEVVDVDM